MNGNFGGTLLDRFHTVDSVALDALFPSTSRDSVPTNIRTQTMFREREREREITETGKQLEEEEEVLLKTVY